MDKDEDDKFWCSTKVDENGVHIDGEWGYCDRDCNRFKTGQIVLMSIIDLSYIT